RLKVLDVSALELAAMMSARKLPAAPSAVAASGLKTAGAVRSSRQSKVGRNFFLGVRSEPRGVEIFPGAPGLTESTRSCQRCCVIGDYLRIKEWPDAFSHNEEWERVTENRKTLSRSWALARTESGAPTELMEKA